MYKHNNPRVARRENNVGRNARKSPGRGFFPCSTNIDVLKGDRETKKIPTFYCCQIEF